MSQPEGPQKGGVKRSHTLNLDKWGKRAVSGFLGPLAWGIASGFWDKSPQRVGKNFKIQRGVRKHTMLERALRRIFQRMENRSMSIVRKHTMLERALRPSCTVSP